MTTIKDPQYYLPTKLSSVGVFQHSWREVVPFRGTLTGWRDASVETSWSSTKPTVRSCTWVRAIQSTYTGQMENEMRAPVKRRTWGCWWMKSSTWPKSVQSQPRKSTSCWAASEEVWATHQGRGSCPSSLLWWHPIRNTASSSGPAIQGRGGLVGTNPEKSHQIDQRAGAPLLWQERQAEISKERRAAWNRTKALEFFQMKKINVFSNKKNFCMFYQRLAKPQTLSVILM